MLRGVEDGKAFNAGMNNTTTARDLATLMQAIESGRAASRASCDAMRDVLLRQEFNGEIPAGLPPGTKVAHKTGFIAGVLHDAAVVYPQGRRPYVLVVLTRGIPEEAVARRLIADVSKLVYEHAMSTTVRTSMNVAVGTDHGGFALKETIVDAIRDRVEAHDGDRLRVHFVIDARRRLSGFLDRGGAGDRRRSAAWRGVLICGSGVGAFPGRREQSARRSLGTVPTTVRSPRVRAWRTMR